MLDQDNFTRVSDLEEGPCKQHCPFLRINKTYDKWRVINLAIILFTGLVLMILIGLKVIKT